MATYKVVKGAVGPRNFWLYKFTNDLVACVNHACRKIAIDISGQPDTAFGTDARVVRASGTAGSTAADAFALTSAAPHANSYARHFMSVSGRTTRMDLGNLVEQLAVERLRASYKGWVEGTHYLYQQSAATPPRFPVNYVGAGASARPDLRYEFYSGQPNGDEAVFDFTTPLQAGHLLNKRIGASTIGAHARIPVAVEIIWEDKEFYNV